MLLLFYGLGGYLIQKVAHLFMQQGGFGDGFVEVKDRYIQPFPFEGLREPLLVQAVGLFGAASQQVAENGAFEPLFGDRYHYGDRLLSAIGKYGAVRERNNAFAVFKQAVYPCLSA